MLWVRNSEGAQCEQLSFCQRLGLGWLGLDEAHPRRLLPSQVQAPGQDGWGMGTGWDHGSGCLLEALQHGGPWVIRRLTQGLPSLRRSDPVNKEDDVRPFLTQPWKSQCHSHHSPETKPIISPQGSRGEDRDRLSMGGVSKNLWPCFKTAIPSKAHRSRDLVS